MIVDKYSLESYKAILEALVPNACGNFTYPPEAGILLRHDVDYCLFTAAKLAEVNHAHSVTATFFILVSSPLYNIFSAEDCRSLRQIVNNGQNIGMHYHHTDGPLNVDRLEREFSALRLVVPEAQRVVAWHNPEGELEELNRQANQAGFISTYENKFFGPDHYMSDSNMRRNSDEIILSIQQTRGQLLQVLLHPLIWLSGQTAMIPMLRAMLKSKEHRINEVFMENSVWFEQASYNGGQ